MKAILIEIDEGVVTRVAILENAPKEGVVICDHDSLVSGNSDALDEIFENFYEPDGDIEDYETFKTNLEAAYAHLNQ